MEAARDGAERRTPPADLEGLTLRQLKARARELGVSDDAIEELDDAPDAKAAAVDLVKKATPAPVPTEEELRAELEGLTLRQLKARAREAGASEDDVDALDDAPDAKAAALDLVVKHVETAQPLPTGAELRAELEGLTLRQLKARAREGGATEDDIDGLEDAADPKAAAIELVVTHTQVRADPEVEAPPEPEPEPDEPEPEPEPEPD
eukprot:COSAG04_NODE_7200_length_1169_cov_1.218692_1_plen_206_part_10